VGPITALAFVLILGRADRFRCGKQVGSYLGLIPSEESSGGRQRFGRISKQGNTLLRFLLQEAAQAMVNSDPEWRRRYLHLALRRDPRVAKVAMARKLAVSLFWLWRKADATVAATRFGSHVG
jgi:transposase